MLASPLQVIGCELLVEGTRGRAEEFTRAPLPEPALDLRHDLVLDASKPIPEHHGSARTQMDPKILSFFYWQTTKLKIGRDKNRARNPNNMAKPSSLWKGFIETP